jgi:hypothetical protein
MPITYFAQASQDASLAAARLMNNEVLSGYVKQHSKQATYLYLCASDFFKVIPGAKAEERSLLKNPALISGFLRAIYGGSPLFEKLANVGSQQWLLSLKEYNTWIADVVGPIQRLTDGAVDNPDSESYKAWIQVLFSMAQVFPTWGDIQDDSKFFRLVDPSKKAAYIKIDALNQHLRSQGKSVVKEAHEQFMIEPNIAAIDAFLRKEKNAINEFAKSSKHAIDFIAVDIKERISKNTVRQENLDPRVNNANSWKHWPKTTATGQLLLKAGLHYSGAGVTAVAKGAWGFGKLVHSWFSRDLIIPEEVVGVNRMGMAALRIQALRRGFAERQRQQRQRKCDALQAKGGKSNKRLKSQIVTEFSQWFSTDVLPKIQVFQRSFRKVLWKNFMAKNTLVFAAGILLFAGYILPLMMFIEKWHRCIKFALLFSIALHGFYQVFKEYRRGIAMLTSAVGLYKALTTKSANAHMSVDQTLRDPINLPLSQMTQSILQSILQTNVLHQSRTDAGILLSLQSPWAAVEHSLNSLKEGDCTDENSIAYHCWSNVFYDLSIRYPEWELGFHYLTEKRKAREKDYCQKHEITDLTDVSPDVLPYVEGDLRPYAGKISVFIKEHQEVLQNFTQPLIGLQSQLYTEMQSIPTPAAHDFVSKQDLKDQETWNQDRIDQSAKEIPKSLGSGALVMAKIIPQLTWGLLLKPAASRVYEPWKRELQQEEFHSELQKKTKRLFAKRQGILNALRTLKAKNWLRKKMRSRENLNRQTWQRKANNQRLRRRRLLWVLRFGLLYLFSSYKGHGMLSIQYWPKFKYLLMKLLPTFCVSPLFMMLTGISIIMLYVVLEAQYLKIFEPQYHALSLWTAKNTFRPSYMPEIHGLRHRIDKFANTLHAIKEQFVMHHLSEQQRKSPEYQKKQQFWLQDADKYFLKIYKDKKLQNPLVVSGELALRSLAVAAMLGNHEAHAELLSQKKALAGRLRNGVQLTPAQENALASLTNLLVQVRHGTAQRKYSAYAQNHFSADSTEVLRYNALVITQTMATDLLLRGEITDHWARRPLQGVLMPLMRMLASVLKLLFSRVRWFQTSLHLTGYRRELLRARRQGLQISEQKFTSMDQSIQHEGIEISHPGQKKPTLLFFPDRSQHYTQCISYCANMAQRLDCNVFVVSSRCVSQSSANPVYSQSYIKQDVEASLAYLRSKNIKDITLMGQNISSSTAQSLVAHAGTKGVKLKCILDHTYCSKGLQRYYNVVQFCKRVMRNIPEALLLKLFWAVPYVFCKAITKFSQWTMYIVYKIFGWSFYINRAEHLQNPEQHPIFELRDRQLESMAAEGYFGVLPKRAKKDNSNSFSELYQLGYQRIRASLDATFKISRDHVLKHAHAPWTKIEDRRNMLGQSIDETLKTFVAAKVTEEDWEAVPPNYKDSELTVAADIIGPNAYMTAAELRQHGKQIDAYIPLADRFVNAGKKLSTAISVG